MKVLIKYLVVAVGLVLVVPAIAAGGGGPKVAEGVNYIPLEPALVVNYGGPGGKSRFIKAELSIRTETGEAAIEVTHHLPLIRDRLVSILSAQTEEMISTVEGKEYLRVYALAEINKALLKVKGHHVDENDAKSAGGKNVGGTPSHNEIKQQEHHAEAGPAPAVPAIADIKPVNGPASDLYFNNFVVQK